MLKDSKCFTAWAWVIFDRWYVLKPLAVNSKFGPNLYSLTLFFWSIINFDGSLLALNPGLFFLFHPNPTPDVKYQENQTELQFWIWHMLIKAMKNQQQKRKKEPGPKICCLGHFWGTSDFHHCCTLINPHWIFNVNRNIIFSYYLCSTKNRKFLSRNHVNTNFLREDCKNILSGLIVTLNTGDQSYVYLHINCFHRESENLAVFWWSSSIGDYISENTVYDFKSFQGRIFNMSTTAKFYFKNVHVFDRYSQNCNISI